MMGLLLGLVAALSLGIADFLARFSATLVGAYRTLLYMQLLGLVGLSLSLIVTGLSLPLGMSRHGERVRACSIDCPALSSIFVPNGASESVIGWTGTDAMHHLNVETSTDVLNEEVQLHLSGVNSALR